MSEKLKIYSNTPDKPHKADYGALFDMDGTIVDTIEGNLKIYNEILRRDYGVELKPEDVPKYNGTTPEERIRRFEDILGVKIDFDKFEEEADAEKEIYFANIPAKPGALELFKSLKHEGAPMALGTSSTLETVQQRLGAAGLLPMLDAIITKEDVGDRTKPDGFTYRLAAERINMPTDRTIVFEDTPMGIEAGKDADAKTIGIYTPHIPRERLEKSKPDHIVESLEDVSTEMIQDIINSRYNY